MAITLFEYQVLYLVLLFLKFLLDLLLQLPFAVFSDLASACYSASNTQKTQCDILMYISYQPSQISYIITYTPAMFLSRFVTTLFIPFLLLLLLVSSAYTKVFFTFVIIIYWTVCLECLYTYIVSSEFNYAL